MGWREEFANTFDVLRNGQLGTTEDALAWLLSLPPADRIALARELLQGTGRVVARDVGEWPDKRAQLSDAQGYYRAAWNACRAKMLEDEP